MPTRLCLEPRCPNPAVYRGRCVVPVGGSITITLAGPDDTKVKGHGALR